MAGRTSLAALALAGLLLGAPGATDERHPRAPDQPLPIVFTPYYCSLCVKRGQSDAEPREVELMRSDASALAKRLGIKRDWLVIESPDFKIFATLKGAKVRHVDTPFAAADLQRLKTILPDFKPGSQGSYLTPHARAHLYQIRLERICSHFRALTGNTLPFLGMGGRFQVYLFASTKQLQAYVEGELGRAYDVRNLVHRKHFPGEENYYIFATAADLFKGGDRELNNIAVHHTAHLLINGHHDFLTDVWAWLEAGTAHFYERRESPQYNYFCLEGQAQPQDYVRGNWRKKIRHLVYRKKDPSLGGWCDKLHTQQLTGVQHALAWSIVEWLAKTDPIRLAKLMDLSGDERKLAAADAIEKVYGITPYALHERWRKYVLKEYKGA